VAFACGALFVTQIGFNTRRSAGPNALASKSAALNAQSVNNVVLAAPGRFEGQSDVIEIGAGADGILTAVRVREGQQVVAGEVLATVACNDLEAERRAALAEIESARQAQRRLLRGSRDEERRIASLEVASAEAALKQAQSHYQRHTSLYETGDVARAQWEQARRELEVAAAALRGAQERAALVSARALPEELARADAEVRAAASRAEALTARAGKCQIRAPQAGRVLRVHRLPGETVSAVTPSPVISLADLSRLRVRAEVDERDLGRLRIGQAAAVHTDAFPEKQYAGRVVAFGALMGRKRVRTGDPAEKSDRDVLEVLIELAERDERLVVGLRTSVRFLAE